LVIGAIVKVVHDYRRRQAGELFESWVTFSIVRVIAKEAANHEVLLTSHLISDFFNV
jgi:predicted component of viral defense system (DUF524 family)